MPYGYFSLQPPRRPTRSTYGYFGLFGRQTPAQPKPAPEEKLYVQYTLPGVDLQQVLLSTPPVPQPPAPSFLKSLWLRIREDWTWTKLRHRDRMLRITRRFFGRVF